MGLCKITIEMVMDGVWHVYMTGVHTKLHFNPFIVSPSWDKNCNFGQI